jgi:hypothetical protein
MKVDGLTEDCRLQLPPLSKTWNICDYIRYLLEFYFDTGTGTALFSYTQVATSSTLPLPAPPIMTDSGGSN